MLRAICVLNESYPMGPTTDGAARRRELTTEALARHGVAIHVITRGTSPGYAGFIRQGVVVHRFTPGDPSTTWADAAAGFLGDLDGAVHFDTVVVLDPHPSDATIASFVGVPVVRFSPTGFARTDALAAAPGEAVDSVPDPDRAGAYLEQIEALVTPLRLPSALRAPERRTRIGVVVRSRRGVIATRRTVLSLLEHTTTQLSLVVVTSPQDRTDAWVEALADPRVSSVPASRSASSAADRNVGLDALSGDAEFVFFLEDDVETLASWFEPYLDVFSLDVSVALVGAEGARVASDGLDPGIRLALTEPGRCDVVFGPVVALRREWLERIGRFDERPGVGDDVDEDFSLRARRVGATLVAARAGRIVHFASGATVDPTAPVHPEAPAADPERVAARRVRHVAGPASPFLVICDATEFLASPELLRTWCGAMAAEDESALVVFGPGLDPAELGARVGAVAAAVGIKLDEGPRVIVLAPTSFSPRDLDALADEAYAYMGATAPTGAFAQLAWLAVGDPGRVRALAARAWRARPVAEAEPNAARDVA